MGEESQSAPFLVRLSDVALNFLGEKILDNLSFEIPPCKLITLVGPNGAGKTSLLKLILGLTLPTRGVIERRPALRIGYMPQKFLVNSLLPLTVERFLALIPYPHLSISESLHAVSGTFLRDKFLHHLSGGELQRVLLAQALINAPHFLILDEPTQGLDIDGQRLFYALLQTFREAHPESTILLASHDLYMVLKTSDQVICLNGHICCLGHPDNIRQHPSYLKLFGEETPMALAPYTHHHTHHHSSD